MVLRFLFAFVLFWLRFIVDCYNERRCRSVQVVAGVCRVFKSHGDLNGALSKDQKSGKNVRTSLF